MPTVTVTKNRNRNRRFTACHRHPSEPVTGFCALCLRDRLAGLDDIIDSDVVVCSRRTKGDGVGGPAPVPELRRSKSVAGECKGFKNVVMDQRRSSCDVRPRTSLSDLFEVEVVKPNCSSIAENIENVDENEADNENDGKIRVLDDMMEADLKTMKEIIEIELQNKPKNIWETASDKMRKWRKQKQKEKKQKKNGQSEVADYGYGRRSCDTEPRFSIDVPHRLSVEDSQLFFDEHRASWDGYMITSTMPRLTPMLSGVDNVMLGNGNLQMQSISEDGGSSGGSGQSNSDCCGSNRGGSSSSSSTKTVRLGGVDDVKLGSNAKVSPANDVIFQGTKLVITEKELKDWQLNSVMNEKVESVANAPVLASKTSVTSQSSGHKKVMSSSWRKVCNLWGHKHKLDDKNGDKKDVERTPVNAFERGNSSKIVRNPGSVNSRNRIEHSGRDLVLDRNRSTRYSTSDIDSGLLRLYLTPFRNSRRSKSGKSRAPLMGTNGLQLN